MLKEDIMNMEESNDDKNKNNSIGDSGKAGGQANDYEEDFIDTEVSQDLDISDAIESDK